MTPPLSPPERKELRARAHHLDPVVMVGDAGLTPAVLAEVERALVSHGLIKVRVLGDDRDARGELMARIARETGAQPVQIIGKLLVLYRPGGDNAGVAEPTAPTRPKLSASRARAPAAGGPAHRSAAAGFARQTRDRNDKALWDGKAQERARRSADADAPPAAPRRGRATPAPAAGGPGARGSAARAPTSRAAAARGPAPRSGAPRTGAPRQPRDGSARPNGLPARTTEGAVRSDGFGRRPDGAAGNRRSDSGLPARRAGMLPPAGGPRSRSAGTDGGGRAAASPRRGGAASPRNASGNDSSRSSPARPPGRAAPSRPPRPTGEPRGASASRPPGRGDASSPRREGPVRPPRRAPAGTAPRRAAPDAPPRRGPAGGVPARRSATGVALPPRTGSGGPPRRGSTTSGAPPRRASAGAASGGPPRRTAAGAAAGRGPRKPPRR